LKTENLKFLARLGFREYAVSIEAEAKNGFGGTQCGSPMNRDYYEVLGLDSNASYAQVQAAYKYWAKELQPLPDSPITEALCELQDAYSALAHAERRRAYDVLLRGEHSSGLKAEPFRPPGPAEPPIKTTPRRRGISLIKSFETFHPSFDELFDRYWSNFDSVTRPKAEHLESLTIDVPLTPDEARTGGTARVLIPVRAECSACAGHGALGYYQCWHCSGHGSITTDYPVEIPYPAGLLNEQYVRVSLSKFGIRNFYLTIRFHVVAPA
jgi:molecular chaperone DnaJ